MKFGTKIRELHILKNRNFCILLGVQFFLIILGIIGLFGKNKVYSYNLENMTVNFGSYEQGGIYADTSSEGLGNMVEFRDLALPAGTYRVQLEYNTDTDSRNSCTVTDTGLNIKELQTNGTVLFSGLNRTDYDMWLMRNTSRLTVNVIYSGEGFLTVKGLTIRQTNAMNRIILFFMLCCFMLINSGYIYMQYDRLYKIPVKSKTVTFFLGLIVIGTAAPLFVDYMIGGGDLTFHLLRVEGIVDGIRAGQFPIRISPEWQQGYGYASPIFYGETILYLEALFRLIGFSVTASYRLFQFVIAFATVLISYFSFKKIFRDAYIGVFCSMLYSISVYRIYKTWICGAFGETLGIMLLPIILYGFYRVFVQDIYEKSYMKSWLPLTIGFSLLIQSHLLTGELTGLFTIIFCIVLWKRVLRPKTFLVLAETVFFSCLLSAWFLIPFADYMLTGDFVIQHVSARQIQSRGLYLAHLLFTFYKSGGTVFFDQSGMYDSAPMGVGIVLIAGLAVFLYLFLTGKLKKLKKEEQVLGLITGFLGILALWMSLSIFPWDRIQSINPILATLVSSIQFPNRFLTIATLCLTAVAGTVAKYMFTNADKKMILTFFAGMAALTLISVIYLSDNMMNSASCVRVYNHEGMGTGYISGAEYLPYGADARLFTWHDPVCTGELVYDAYEKKSLGASARMVNVGNDTEQVSFGLLYYKGYHAYARNDGRELPCYAGENFEVTVDIPAGFAGDIYVQFESPWYWRLGELITCVTVFVMILWQAMCKGGTAWQRSEM